MSKAQQIPDFSAKLALPLVEAFLAATPAVSATALGKTAKKDPHMVFAMRAGREVRPSTLDAIVAVIEANAPGFTTQFVRAARKAQAHG